MPRATIWPDVSTVSGRTQGYKVASHGAILFASASLVAVILAITGNVSFVGYELVSTQSVALTAAISGVVFVLLAIGLRANRSLFAWLNAAAFLLVFSLNAWVGGGQLWLYVVVAITVIQGCRSAISTPTDSVQAK